MADETKTPETTPAPVPVPVAATPSEIINAQTSPSTPFGPTTPKPEDSDKFFTKKDVAIGIGAAAGVVAATTFALPVITTGIVAVGATTLAWQGLKRFGSKLFG